MKKRSIVPVLIMIVALSATALAESLFTGTVKDGEIVTAGNLSIELTVAGEGAAYLKYDSQALLIPEGECRSKGNIDFCIGAITYVSRNVTTYEELYETTLDVTHLEALELNKTTEKTDIYTDESTGVSIVFKNTGKTDLVDIQYNDTYPANFLIKDVQGCSFNKAANTVQWFGTMTQNARFRCSYTLMGMKPISYKSNAAAFYNDGMFTNTVSYETKLNIKNYSLQVTPKFNKTTVSIGDAVNMTIRIKNIDDAELEVSDFIITLPKDAKLLDIGGDIQRNAGKITWSDTLVSDEEKIFSMQIQLLNRGDNIMAIQYKYKEGQFFRDLSDEIKIPVHCDCPAIEHSSIDMLSAGSDLPFRVVLKNPSRLQKFKSLKVTGTTNIAQFTPPSINFDTFLPNDEAVIVSDTIRVPETGFFYYNMSIEYTTEFGQEIIDKKEIVIKAQEYAQAQGGAVINETEVKEEVIVSDEKEAPVPVAQEQHVKIIKPSDRTGTIVGSMIVGFVVIILGAVIKLLLR
ncbi:MAG TPA: hypothetical protein VJB66_01400 [Candidatus Nanoarchaeia archaeon]|nr:hypothetical protein [Candidatus Nanoarchaeia archaeon]